MLYGQPKCCLHSEHGFSFIKQIELIKGWKITPCHLHCTGTLNCMTVDGKKKCLQLSKFSHLWD